MNKRIVYNSHEGGVSICCPSDHAIAWMTCGGFDLWQSKPRGFAETQIERQIARGVNPDAARRYARAAMFGGCTTAEALEIIRDRDCAHLGTAIELWDVADIPRDRWFRDAWRRSHNGGPISVNLNLAKPIQFKRAKLAVERENKRRADEFAKLPAVEVDWDAFRSKVSNARDEHELRAAWPVARI